MIRPFMTLLMVILLVMFMSGAALAGAGTDPSTKEKSSSMTEESKAAPLFHQGQRISKLIGTEVQNSEGKTLGRIEDLIAAEDGRLHYLVIARGGVMGLGSKLIPVPISEVPASVSSEGKCIVDIDKTVFDQAPSFDSDQWPEVRKWQEEARGYFGSQSTLTPADMPMPMKESEEGQGSGSY